MNVGDRLGAGLPWTLAGFLLLIVLQRVIELMISTRNARKMRTRGGREHGRGHYPLLVLIHTLFPLALAAEVLWLQARPGRLAPLWLALWLGAQALRYASIRALGDRWNARIWVVPGERRVGRGPYRYLRHPNYLAVVVELLSAPLVFGAWRTAVALSAINALALRHRIRVEERALEEAEIGAG